MTALAKLLQKVTTALLFNKLQIATAESCTGGLLASLLTDLPGSSQWFERGFVTYSNLAKEEMLGVQASLLALHGAVSEQVAQAMVLGTLQFSKADLAVAITGIAGPSGGNEKKPIGIVYCAWAWRANLAAMVTCYNFPAISRQQIRQLACQRALEGILSMLETLPRSM